MDLMLEAAMFCLANQSGSDPGELLEVVVVVLLTTLTGGAMGDGTRGDTGVPENIKSEDEQGPE